MKNCGVLSHSSRKALTSSWKIYGNNILLSTCLFSMPQTVSNGFIIGERAGHLFCMILFSRTKYFTSKASFLPLYHNLHIPKFQNENFFLFVTFVFHLLQQNVTYTVILYKIYNSLLLYMNIFSIFIYLYIWEVLFFKYVVTFIIY